MFSSLMPLRQLKPDEVRNAIAIYNRFVAEWNAQESDRSKPLPRNGTNGLSVEMTRRRGAGRRLFLFMEPEGLAVELHTPGWDTWLPGSLFSPFLRRQLCPNAVRVGYAFQIVPDGATFH